MSAKNQVPIKWNSVDIWQCPLGSENRAPSFMKHIKTWVSEINLHQVLYWDPLINHFIS